MDAKAAIAWIDVETTGVDIRDGHYLLQVASILTDEKFREISTFERKVYFSAAEVETLKIMSDPIALELHRRTGLWDALADEKNPSYDELDEQFSLWLKTFQPVPGVLLFGGNSVFLDRNFVNEFLPKSYAHLSYHDLNMTSVEAFFTFTENRPPFQKIKSHNALDDIRESIDQARYHQTKSLPF